MSLGKYVLGADARTPVKASLTQWARSHGSPRAERKPAAGDSWARVGDDTLNGWRVSTVFLGLDHQWGDGPPLLFETMIFRDGDVPDVAELNEWQDRYSTWAEAEAGHAAALAMIRKHTIPPVEDGEVVPGRRGR